MTIAVNTRLLFTGHPEGYGCFIQEVFRRITQQHPEHTFIFLSDKAEKEQFDFGSNCKSIIIRQAGKHSLFRKLWYDIKIPALLKKHTADVFVCCDGYCSLTAKVPQCLLAHSPVFFTGSQLRYYKKHIVDHLTKALSIATVSSCLKQEIEAQYDISPDKMSVVHPATNKLFVPLNAEERQRVKDTYTGGMEYFVYTGAIHPQKNLMLLLKAFSVFKKKQKTAMKLVLAGKLAPKYDSFRVNLQSYKYRTDVLLTGSLPDKELAAITAAAYAMVIPSAGEGFAVPELEAMQCKIPVISAAEPSLQEIAGEAALYANPENYEELAAQMILLYKDEGKRNELIQKGTAVAQRYSWDKTAGIMWECIFKTRT
ncbi:MAG: glycosyltransferase family 1 protein [Chitinophagaceae bacterium]